ncbi:glycosyltransferase [Bacteroidota bacterium]
MHLLWIISLSLLAAYALLIFIYSIGWQRLSGKSREISEETPGISLVIPVRDEENNIGLLLEDLVQQEYPTDAFEIIIVDDHSADNTPEIVRTYREKHHELRLISLLPTESGKKAALQKGIENASHSLILTTDGDCRVSSGWVAGMMAGFSDPRVRMMIGTVIFSPERGIFASMQSLEFFSLTAVTAGTTGLGDPILCSAANLGYYRDDYLEFLNQKAKVSESGDDIFMLMWLKKQKRGSIRFSASTSTVVNTLPAESLISFLSQRIRWTSKSRYYRDFHLIISAFLVFGMNVLLLAILLAGIWESKCILLFAILFMAKSAVDLLFLAPVLRHHGKVRLLRVFILLEIVYFVYVSLIGLFGQFLSFSWKGRKSPTFRQNKSIGKGH